jgi:Baseplate J-like protein
MAIYYLDVDDEITSAAARIRDSSDNRIALVLSGGSRVATSRINFRLLAREARHRNKRLAIITGDPSVQSVARSAELPVYASVGEYERAEAARARGLAEGTRTDASDALDELALTVGPGSHAAAAGSGAVDSGGARGGAPARPSRVTGGPVVGTSGAASGFGMRVSKTAVAGIGAILILVLAAAAFFFYPSATVAVTLREEPVGPIALSVKVDPGVSAPNDQAGTVPGLTKDFPVSVSGTFDATGQKVVETAATGTVTFTTLNNTFSVPVPNGARVTTVGGTAFLTTAAVMIPRATTSPVHPYTTTPGRVDAPIQAVTKGTTGNVAAGSIVKPPSNLPAGSQVFVTNRNPTTGGTHTVTPQIQKSDIDNAQNSLYGQLGSRFKDALAAPDAVPTGSTLLDASAQLGLATCNPDPAGLINQDGASFDLACTGTGTATLADMTAVKGLGERRVKASVKTGYELVANSVTTELGMPIVQGSAVVVPVTVRAMQVPVVDPNAIRAGVKGKSLDEARAFASRYGTVEISVSPGWASTMPSFDFRIDIQLVAPSIDAGSSASPGASVAPSDSITASNPPVTGRGGSASPPAASTPPA